MRIPGIADLVPFDRYVESLDSADFVEVEGRRVFVRDVGPAEGPTIVCLHGFASSSYSFRYLYELMSGQFRILGVDLNGFGATERPRDFANYEIESQARQIRKVLERKSISRAVFLGHSYGGAVVSVFARDNPELVEKVILVSPPSDFGAKPPWYLRNPAGLHIAYGMVRLLLSSPDRFKKISGRAVHKKEVLTEEISELYRKSMLVEGFREAFYGYAVAFENGKVECVNYSGIQHPVLVLAGRNDEVVSVESCRALADSIPGSQFREIDDCGHCGPEEQPELFAALIGEFAGVPERQQG